MTFAQGSHSLPPPDTVAGVVLPEAFRKDVPFSFENVATYQTWLMEVEQRAAKVANDWGLELLEVLPGGAASCVFRCRTVSPSPMGAVLKLPTRFAPSTEVPTLRLWAGMGVVPEVFRADEQSGIVLMELLQPAENSPEFIPVADATHLLQRLHNAPTNSSLPTITETGLPGLLHWFQKANPTLLSAGLDAYQLGHALATGAEQEGQVALCHGDFVRKNMMNTANGWRCFDPQPLVGDGLYDVARWFAYGLLRGGYANTAPEAIDVLSDIAQLLELDRDGLLRLRWWVSAILVLEWRERFGSEREALMWELVERLQ